MPKFLDLLWLAIPGYLILQVVALLRTSGGSRVAAALLLFVMVPVFAIAAQCPGRQPTGCDLAT